MIEVMLGGVIIKSYLGMARGAQGQARIGNLRFLIHVMVGHGEYR